jgi:hypothetical protein
MLSIRDILAPERSHNRLIFGKKTGGRSVKLIFMMPYMVIFVPHSINEPLKVINRKYLAPGEHTGGCRDWPIFAKTPCPQDYFPYLTRRVFTAG